MKLLLKTILVSTAVFFILGCNTTTDYAKKYPAMVANADPVSAGTIEAEFDKLFSSKLEKNDVEVVFYPRLNAVALEFRYELIRYRQFWDEAARQQFTAALELYKEDYAARKLIDRYKKTRAVYGKVKGKIEWETFKYAQTRTSYPAIELGYRFRGEAPFFVTLMRSAREAMENKDDSQQLDSAQISIYFTRAQADDLVKLFDQSYLMALLEKNDSLKSDGSIAVDPYREFGDK